MTTFFLSAFQFYFSQGVPLMKSSGSATEFIKNMETIINYLTEGKLFGNKRYYSTRVSIENKLYAVSSMFRSNVP